MWQVCKELYKLMLFLIVHSSYIDLREEEDQQGPSMVPMDWIGFKIIGDNIDKKYSSFL